MLENTFLHISGIGQKTEKAIWQAGIHSWNDFSAPASTAIRPSARRLVEDHLRKQPKEALTSASYFSGRLPASQHWRLFPHFRDKTAFIDIETTGINRETSIITTIALYDGSDIFTFVHGDNLDAFPDQLAKYHAIVTYNGRGFDVPMLENYFRIKIDQAHLDLRPILAALGYKGGLKGCERQLGIGRTGLQGVDGYDAVILWNEYKRCGQQELLDTLLAYNIADTINLEPLLVMAYNLNIASTPFAASHYLAAPEPPKNLFKPDAQVIKGLRQYRGSYR